MTAHDVAPASSRAEGGRRLVALASLDPLDPGTFSGLSRQLFDELALLGCEVTPLASRDLRWHDVARGAVRPRAVLGRATRDHRTPMVDPDWTWSRRGFDRMSARLSRRLAAVPLDVPVLQVGTQVDASLGPAGRAVHCITDCTVPQALAAGEFSVSRASPRVQSEAVECQRQVLRSCRRVLTLSEWARCSVIHDLGVEPDRVVTVGAGANLRAPLPRRPDLTRPTVLFVGRDWERKSGPLLVEAFRLVRQQRPDARLAVVGCEPALQDEPGVEVVGVLDRSRPQDDRRLRELYATAACFALVSSFDPFPNVVLEAGHAGVPVVSTAEGSRIEAVLDGVTGRLAPTRRPDDIARALLDVLDDPALAAHMGAAASVWVAARFTWPVVGRRVMDAVMGP